MNVLSFELSGEFALFKNHEVNQQAYFTFSHIHKVALFGILGSVAGYSGYAQQGDAEYPEFYERLKDVKVSIVPLARDVYFSKKIQKTNNHVGFASKEVGGNLIISEQLLEQPKWRVFVCVDENTSGLVKIFLNGESKYVPYLGKNDHPARIDNVKLMELCKVDNARSISSLFVKSEGFEFSRRGTVDFLGSSKRYFYEEFLPIGLTPRLNHYVMDKVMATNLKIDCVGDLEVFEADEFNIVFL